MKYTSPPKLDAGVALSRRFDTDPSSSADTFVTPNFKLSWGVASCDELGPSSLYIIGRIVVVGICLPNTRDKTSPALVSVVVTH